MPELLQLVVLGLAGLAVGSFINAYVWRSHNAQESNYKDSGKKGRESSVPNSVFDGRSVCPDCGRQLSAIDLIPVVSWALLRGRCRYCNSNISIQYPIVEFTTLAIFILSTAFWPFAIEGSMALILLTVWLATVAQFIALSLYDFKWYILPDRMVIVLLVLVAAFRLLEAIGGAPLSHWLINAIAGGGIAFALFYGLFVLGKGRWMGGGDVKLVAVLGLLLGFGKTLLGLFLAFNLAALVSIALIIFGQRDKSDKVQFGPFLILGAWLSMLFGSEIIDWYLRLSF